MNFNIYIDDKTGEQLNHAAGETGESRNSLIRRAVSEWLDRHGVSRWPDEVMNFNGVADVGRFEDSRAKLRPPAADPFA
jgi:predicted transcriptional regulator